MAQPPAYNRSKNFVTEITNSTAGASLNTEFNNVSSSISGIRTNLAAIQKDDTTLKNGIVKADTLDANLLNSIKQDVMDRITGEALGAIVQNYIELNGIDLQAEIQKALEDVSNDVAVINDNSASTSSVFSSSKVNTLLGGYLPLSANKTVTGTVNHSNSEAIRSTATNSLIGITACPSGTVNGARLALHGKDRSTLGGAFALYTGDGSANKTLQGTKDGILSWNGATVNLSSASVTAKTVSTSGNMSCTGTLSAGVFSPATLTMKNKGSIITEDSSGNYMGLKISANGTYANTGTGGGLNLKSLTAGNTPGGWELLSRTNAVSYTLRGTASGELQYTGQFFTSKNVNTILRHDDNKHATFIRSGIETLGSPSIVLYGTEHSETANKGKFRIYAGANKYQLIGSPDGKLEWGNKTKDNEMLLQVAKSSDITVDNTTSATTNSGYVTLVNGLTFAWGLCQPGKVGSTTVQFPCTFTAVHSVVATDYSTNATESDTAGVDFGVMVYGQTKSSFKVSIANDANRALKWMAIGYISQE